MDADTKSPDSMNDMNAEATMKTPSIETVTLPGDSPLVAIRLSFDVGSIHDPKGKEGLAALTARMVGEAGTAKLSYAEQLDALYPMAAQIQQNAGREVTTIGGVVHRDTLARYTDLLLDAVLHPGFAASDLERHKSDMEAYLTTTLRSSNDELLGLEALQDEIYAGHPYGHPPQGTVKSLAALTLDDVKRFYAEHYTQANLLLGVAGGYPEGYVESLTKKLAAALPAGEEGHRELPPAPQVEGRRFTLIDKDTASVGIQFGYPLPFNRADDDYYPMMVANSYLGEHRTFHGRLMQQLRGDGVSTTATTPTSSTGTCRRTPRRRRRECRAASSTSASGSARCGRRRPTSRCATPSTRSSACASAA